MGRIQYAPTLTAEKGASNKHLFAPGGAFGGRIQYAPTLTAEKGASNKHLFAPGGAFGGRMLLRPYTGQQKTENKQREDSVPGQIGRHP